MSIKTEPFDPADYLAEPEAQLAAICEAYECGEAGLIDRMLDAVIRARKLQNEGNYILDSRSTFG